MTTTLVLGALNTVIAFFYSMQMLGSGQVWSAAACGALCLLFVYLTASSTDRRRR